MKSIFKKRSAWFGALLGALISVVGLVTPALAYTTIDLTRETSLTLNYVDSRPISNARFSIYRVGDVSERVQCTLAGDFAKYPVELNGLDSEGWRAAAETLAAYAQRDRVEKTGEGTTDDQGKLTFGNLTTGLYLVTGQSREIGRYTYTPEPMLILLPSLDQNDQWMYHVTAAPKYDRDYDPPSGGGDEPSPKVSRKVLKVWHDDGHKEQRPESIEVQLLCDGDVYDTVTLNEENGWKYTWKDLDKRYTWQVTESEVPEGYKVSVSREGITFKMTNTYSTDIPDDPNRPRNPYDPDDPRYWLWDPDSPTGFLLPSDDILLPQTGVLWWPVPLLLCAGLALFMTGWIRRNRGDKNHEA